uniref:F-box domain-containing protein n=1 Tax=Myotis myotis TaxID=51298 RepID=A0A7J8AMC3_MYOMY|nr:hypothetical protein mMyoMyo1_007882 [Myotis myotis]
MEGCACLCSVGSSPGCRCRQECQGPAEKAVADGKPIQAEKHVEGDKAALCCAGSGGIASPMVPPPLPHCSLQEMLVEIFAWVPGTDLLSLAQACTKFCHILHIDSIWRWRCREEFGTYGLSLNTHVDGPLQFKPSFRICLTERKPAKVECMEGRHSRPHSRHMQIQKDRLTLRCNNREHQKVLTARLRGEWWLVLTQEDRYQYDCLIYQRFYLPPSHPGDLIQPGPFQGNYNVFGLKIAMLSFHGKYARVTKITGISKEM